MLVYCVVQFICYTTYMQLTILEWRPEPDAGAPLRRAPGGAEPEAAAGGCLWCRARVGTWGVAVRECVRAGARCA